MPLLVDEVLLDKPGKVIDLLSAFFPPSWLTPISIIVIVMLLSMLLRLVALLLAVLQTREFTRVAKDISYRIRVGLLQLPVHEVEIGNLYRSPGLREVEGEVDRDLRLPRAVAAHDHDDAFARETAARGRKTVEERFSVESVVTGTLEVYRELAPDPFVSLAVSAETGLNLDRIGPAAGSGGLRAIRSAGLGLARVRSCRLPCGGLPSPGHVRSSAGAGRRSRLAPLPSQQARDLAAQHEQGDQEFVHGYLGGSKRL